MNTLLKKMEKAAAPVRETGRKPSAREMHERMKDRYPKVMARLAE
ncbi:ChAPs family protein [Pontixanthobacter aestiaquae]|nr:ChAPs family protein [Pontixanthobacter aestiaquae]MDN3645016.1 ChAPs family protein [Pontixanthobacter aestiaquae]